jgi:hypothetical protein
MEVLQVKGRVLASIVVWLAAVASVAGIASVAIDTAGRQVTSGAPNQVLPTDFPPTSDAAADPTLSPSADPTSTATSTPSHSPQHSTSKPHKTSDGGSSQSSTQPVTSTYATLAGRVRASCKGVDITLEHGFAQPAPGWSMDMDSDGPDQIQVVFETRSHALLVVARCVNSSPQFQQIWTKPSHQDNLPHGMHHGLGAGSETSSTLAGTGTAPGTVIAAASASDARSVNLQVVNPEGVPGSSALAYAVA